MTKELETVKQFRSLFMNRYQEARQLKAQGQRIVGWICTYVPEEIIHAAGLFPFRVIGGSPETPRAVAFLYSNKCSVVRNCVEQGLSGSLDFLDGIVACNT
ncbi:MAG: hypothetical protein HYY20_10905 [Candidatus Tectomicrobia bacterium]|uniref:2-hydroxyacyl-CoA dehydratase n=1 Tax=Tectimicrobiota bacterium TaxID=2528274 RepID=A0A932FW33_UNCTE|nr:hypothetical protein [Candidatus Tectomicrobia bacterium]